MDNIKRISIDQLKVGMYIAELNDEWATESNLRAEGLVSRQDTVDNIRAMGIRQIYIDVEKGADCAGGEPVSELHRRSGEQLRSTTGDPLEARVPFEQERKQAQAVREKALSLVSDVMQDVKMGRSFDRGAVNAITEEINHSLINNQNALSSLMRMRHKDQYLLEHSMNVAVLMGVLARSMNIAGEELHQLVFGAFVHDIGKMRVDQNILHKPGRLEAEEWAEMQRHVEYGVEALKEVEQIPPIAMDICSQHHERLDGSGYPYGLSQEQISRHGRMASVVDVYDAITAERVYHSGMEPTTALKKMLEWGGDHLDRDLVYQLIRCISVYPAGALVQLKSGVVAVVQEVNRRKPTRPVVRLVFDPKRSVKLAGQVVDLMKEDRLGEIKGAVSPNKFGLKPEDYL
ncbi:HD-GYP domain-containing protein [Pseudomaricurvus alkylphenolicus]|jgi:putative nucleotidyltransferase with HDIG domain|uniref:HD-GYP domain-containing protein n=1 Tax=Pseudomaricurvus alkylphenolicus TaxID=1306991 RepID=UPI001421D167|nr:HD-GYP domain-containing protein [Pseudomaricurvus alkylphenolicus]NIB39989.1 HD-GYP domain-containing protein [Pseudomaricurvus alkylphenolicus]